MIEEKVIKLPSYDMMIETKEEELGGIRWGISIVINFFLDIHLQSNVNNDSPTLISTNVNG